MKERESGKGVGVGVLGRPTKFEIKKNHKIRNQEHKDHEFRDR